VRKIWLKFSTIKMMLRPSKPWTPANCYDIYKRIDLASNGIYNIYLNGDAAGSSRPTRVYCEMEKGGWTRIFNSVDRNTSFDKRWAEF
jgi:hypothetical protein